MALLNGGSNGRTTVPYRRVGAGDLATRNTPLSLGLPFGQCRVAQNLRDMFVL